MKELFWILVGFYCLKCCKFPSSFIRKEGYVSHMGALTSSMSLPTLCSNSWLWIPWCRALLQHLLHSVWSWFICLNILHEMGEPWAFFTSISPQPPLKHFTSLWTLALKRCVTMSKSRNCNRNSKILEMVGLKFSVCSISIKMFFLLTISSHLGRYPSLLSVILRR